MNKGNNSSKKSYIFLAALILIFFVLIGFVIFNVQVDKFSELMKMEKSTTILFLFTENQKPIVSGLFFYNPMTSKSAMLMIPENTGSIIVQDDINRIDRIDILYNPDNPLPYVNKIEEMTMTNVDFYFILNKENLVKFIDLMNGLTLFIPNEINVRTNIDYYLLPPGSITLDGDKSILYLLYGAYNEDFNENSRIEQNFIQAFLKSLAGKNITLLHKKMFPFVYRLVQTDMDKKSFESFLKEIQKVDADRIIFQNIRGTVREVDGVNLLFPFHEGKILVENVKQIQDILSRPDVSTRNEMVISVEILNGTNVSGMASRTAQFFKSYGYNVAAVSNAERDDYKNTVIIDRKGNAESAGKVADLIKCKTVYTEISETNDETIDVTIILGKDFDGRYVK